MAQFNTKFNIGDKVHTVERMKFTEAEVYSIEIEANMKEVKATYYLRNKQNACIIKRDNELFASHEDMLRYMSDAKVSDQG